MPRQDDYTEEKGDRFCQMAEWVLDVRLSLAQKAKLKDIVRDHYRSGNRERIKEVEIALKEQEKFREKPASERRLRFLHNLPRAVKKIRQAANEGREEARWMCQVFYAAHPIIFDAEPPLTKDVADAWINLDYWLNTYVMVRDPEHKPPKVPAPNPLLRARYYKTLIARWKKFTEEERYKYIYLRLEEVEIKQRWPQMSEKERNQLYLGLLYKQEFFLHPPRPELLEKQR